jgi:hypothetical protein
VDPRVADAETTLRRVVLDCAYLRLSQIADEVRANLRMRLASGAYGVDDHESAWDEYRYEVAEGPTPLLESAWDIDLGQQIEPLIDQLPEPDAILCSVAMSFMMDGDEAGLMEKPAIYKDAILWGVCQQLHEIADEENFREA